MGRDEKIKNISDIDEKNKYDFKNFFINNFNNPIDNNENNENNEEQEDITLEEDKNIQSFKRNKLLWNQWDFIILKWFLDINYNNIKVTPDLNNNYIIKIINSELNTKIKKWNIVNDFKIEFNSNYIFSTLHSFENINLKFINTKNLKEFS